MSDRPRPERPAYPVLRPIQTRWMDDDVYGHVNNVVFYAWFDTAVNGLLVEAGVLDPRAGDVIGLVVETQCAYHAPVAFPDRLEAGVRVERIGTTSVAYGVAIFREGETAAVAHGRFVHVYVDRATRRPVPLPEPLRAALTPLVGEVAA